jgi:hypothetical protein
LELVTILAAEVSAAVLKGMVLTAVHAMNCVLLPVLKVHIVELAVHVVLGTILVVDKPLLGLEGLVALDVRGISGDGPATGLLRMGFSKQPFEHAHVNDLCKLGPSSPQVRVFLEVIPRLAYSKKAPPLLHPQSDTGSLK